MSIDRRWLTAALAAMLMITAAPDVQAQRRRGMGGGGGGRSGTSPLTPELAKAAVAHFEGTLRNFDKKQIVIESDDGQTIVFHRVKTTKIEPKTIELGVHVAVEAHKDSVGDLDAVSMCAGKCSTASDASGAPAAAPATK